MIISMVFGVVVEALARVFKLWVYGQPQTALLNIVAFFGFVMGGIAGVVPALGVWQAFTLAAALGLAYEAVNLRWLQWWHFPGERLLFIRGHHAIVLVLALLWGVLPLTTATVHAALWRPRVLVTFEGRLDRLNEQERRLLDALDATRQKERGLQERLDHVRRKKQVLLDRHEVQPPGPPREAPAAE